MFLTVLDMSLDTVLTSFASIYTCTHLGTLFGPLFDTFLNTLLPSFASKVTTLFLDSFGSRVYMCVLGDKNDVIFWGQSVSSMDDVSEQCPGNMGTTLQHVTHFLTHFCTLFDMFWTYF